MKKARLLSLLALATALVLFISSCAGASNPGGFGTAQNRLGAQLDYDPELVQARLVTMSLDTLALPAKYDNSAYYPNPGDQGNQGSCVGWSTAYALRSAVNRAETGDSGAYTYDYIFSPAYVYNQINGGKDNGSSIFDAFVLIIEQGVCTWSDMPYSDRDYTKQPNAAQKQAAAAYRVEDGYIVETINDIKQLIYENYGVVVGIPVYDSFWDITPQSPVLETASGAFQGGHAICLVG
jgi:C1A family cysteine protease